MDLPPDLAACASAEEFQRHASSMETSDPSTVSLRPDHRAIIVEHLGGLGQTASFNDNFWLVSPDCRAVGLTVATTRGWPTAEIRTLRFEGGPAPTAEEEQILRQAMGGPPLDAPPFEPIPPLPALFRAPVALPHGVTLRPSKPMILAWREGKTATPPLVWARTGEAAPDCPCYAVFDGPKLKPVGLGELKGMDWQTFQTPPSLTSDDAGAVALLDAKHSRHAWLWIDHGVTPLGADAGRAWFGVGGVDHRGYATLVSVRLSADGLPEVQSFRFEGPDGAQVPVMSADANGVKVERSAGETSLIAWSLIVKY